MIPKELARQIRYIQIHTSKAVNDVLAGQYESVFKGRGMEFDEVREYQPGDDVRTIDWNVTARTGHPYVKRFVEERELTVMFLVDLSASGAFGSVRQLKNEVAAELTALLAFAAVKNNDKVGLIVFTDRVELFIPPKKGVTHILRLIRELLNFKMPRRKTNTSLALDYIAKVIRKKATVFLVSDFIESEFKKALSLLNRRHDVIAVPVRDRVEISMPNAGLIEFQDSETGQIILVDTSSGKFHNEYGDKSVGRFDELRNLLRSINVDCISVRTDKPYIQDLVQFFHMRHQRY